MFTMFTVVSAFRRSPASRTRCRAHSPSPSSALPCLLIDKDGAGEILIGKCFFREAAKELGKLDRQVAARIVKTLEERIAPLDEPRTIGSALVGEYAGYWRWRIGDYRMAARIEDERITVFVVRVPQT